MNLTNALTGRFLGRNYVGQAALRCAAFLDVSSLNWRRIGGGRGRRFDRRRPIFPKNECSPRPGDDRRERVTDSVASAAFCLHEKYPVSQPAFTSKCASFQ